MSPYSFRSAMTAGTVLYNDIDSPEFPLELARQAICELKQLRPLFSGDIYPLTTLTTDQSHWYAYQLDRPDLGQGCAFVFRRPASPDVRRQFTLQNIDPAGSYLVSITGETYEQGEWCGMAGRELMELSVAIDTAPGSAQVRYRLGAQK